MQNLFKVCVYHSIYQNQILIFSNVGNKSTSATNYEEKITESHHNELISQDLLVPP